MNILTTMRNGRVILLINALVLSLANNSVLAGAQTEDEIRLEMSYLAMKLLEIKGADTYVLESKALVKPHIGVCSKMKEEGIYLSCITPKSQAAKAGLKSGDLLLSINGISMAGQPESHNSNGEYWKIVREMKIGDQFVFEIADGDESRKVDVTVGSLSHPAYRLEVSKTALVE